MSGNSCFENIKPYLLESATQTFGEIAFVDIYEAKEAKYTHQKDDTILCVEVASPFVGEVYLFIHNALKNKIAENIFADSIENIPEKQVDDSLLEILNVICGDFLGRCFEKNDEIKIGLPGIIYDMPNTLPDNSHWVYFNAEGIDFSILIRKASA